VIEPSGSPKSAPSSSGNGNGSENGNGDVVVNAAPGLDAAARRQLLDEPVGVELPQRDSHASKVGDGSVVPEFAQVARTPAPVDRRLISPAEPESLLKRWIYVVAALALAYGHYYFITSFWAPAHWGNNQNGYLVGAKHLAQSMAKGRFTTGFEPTNPFEFVGWMWVMANENSTAPGGGMHYPKYPLGVPSIASATRSTAPRRQSTGSSASTRRPCRWRCWERFSSRAGWRARSREFSR
jgi:hypothetical protein